MGNARKILIVDDDADLRELLIEQLSLFMRISRPDPRGDGRQASRRGKHAHIDLMLLDVGLPDMDGAKPASCCARAGSRRRSSC